MTWNPVVGCTAVSPGCDHCYAARLASGRLRGTPTYHGLAEGGVFNGTVRLLPDRLAEPLHWRSPQRVFVNSMSDLFHADVPEEFIARVFDVMRRCPQHTFHVLTKRAERMERVVTRVALGKLDVERRPAVESRPSMNVWIGVSVESPAYYSRIRHLQRTPAVVRFLSCEPLLAPLPDLPLDGIDWVIVGGESGPGARPMHPDWVRSIRDQCRAAGVAFFFKQWGEWHPGDLHEPYLTRCLRGEVRSVIVAHDGTAYQHGELAYPDGPRRSDAIRAGHEKATNGRLTTMYRVGKKAAGRELDGRTDDARPVSLEVAPHA